MLIIVFGLGAFLHTFIIVYCQKSNGSINKHFGYENKLSNITI